MLDKAANRPRLLFSPITIGNLELKNRLLMPPMIERLAKHGMVTQAVTDFYAARARGGVGLIVLTPGIIDESMASDIQLGIYEDRFIPSLKAFTEVIHSCGAAIGIELMHLGRQGGEIKRYKPVAPSPIPWSPNEEAPRELTTGEVEDLVEKFAEGARRAREAGFDMVELHACHGYLLSGFLSPHTNQRTDKYGGDVAGRARFVVEIVKLAKERAGSDCPVSCRINGADYMVGGTTLEESKQIAHLLVKAGADLISVSSGAYGSYPVIVPPYDQIQGCNLYLAEGIKQVVNVPVAVAGRLSDPWVAEEALAAGKTDLIAVARGLLADPELPNKAARGDYEDIRNCLSCNVCIDADATKPIQCTVNPEAGREREMTLQPAGTKKRVVVVGGGLAGLEAARVAALRGHKVTLYEEDSEVGGQWLLAAAAPHKDRHAGILDYYKRQLGTAGVDVKTGVRATVEMLSQDEPDALVVATGAEPLVPLIPGVDSEDVVTAWEVLSGRQVGSRVAVLGGGMTGLETAELLVGQGRSVVVIEMLKRVGADLGGTVRWHMMNRIKGLSIELFTLTKVKEIRPGGELVVERNGTEEVWPGFDSIVLACGSRPRKDMNGLSSLVKELYVIGDAVNIRKGLDAIGDGAEVGRQV